MTDFPIGTIGTGAAATVDPAGTVRPVGVDWSVEWWVAGEDRWHHPEIDPTVRQRFLDDAPLLETAVRVPSGDVVSTAFAFAGRGGDPEISLSVRNDSPLPVAVAFVIGPVSDATVAGNELRVGDEVALRVSRTPAVVVAAPTQEELRETVVAAAGIAAGTLTGYVAVVVPLPHTQSCHGLIRPSSDVMVPSVEQVSSGWSAHLDRGTSWSIPGPDADRARQALATVALGPLDRADLGVVARNLRAVLHLGWFDAAADPTETLLAAQGARGGVGDEDSTIEALLALAAWRLAGVPRAHMEGVLLAVAAASRSVARRWRRLDAPRRSRARLALEEARRFLVAMGEAQAAVPVPPEERDIGDSEDVGAGRGDAAGGVVEVVRGLVTDTDDGVELLGGWRREWLGAPLEATGVPTRWGRVGLALRWHGERPALLWEVRSWDPEHDAVPVLTTPRLDPSWSARRSTGETLLNAWAATVPPAGPGESPS